MTLHHTTISQEAHLRPDDGQDALVLLLGRPSVSNTDQSSDTTARVSGALEFGPDGWPIDSITPPPACPNCNGSNYWWDMLGGDHCMKCDPPKRRADRWWRLSRKLQAKHNS